MTEYRKRTIKRIISDIKEINTNPLTDSGIYYKHDESEMYKGYILFCPLDETPYQYGFYIFEISFPYNYPDTPPKLLYKTNNGTTRFHPNFYRNGKVCIDLLNTWRGEQWSSCNTLSSILINLVTLFTNKAFKHEPGITDINAIKLFDDVITYQNFNTAIYKVLTSDMFIYYYTIFKSEIDSLNDKNKKHILTKIKDLLATNPVKHKIIIPQYNMNEIINYDELYNLYKNYN